jgi:hypothetical protein
VAVSLFEKVVKKIGIMYDPTHIDADWGGYVSFRSTRKHFNNDNGSLEANLISVAPNLNASTLEWSKPSRKIIPHFESGTEISHRNRRDNKLRSATFELIGGPLEKDCGDCWDTEARSASRRKKTSLHQLTDKGRSMCIRGKRPKSDTEATFDPHFKSEMKEETFELSASHDTNHSDYIGFRGKVQPCASDPSILKAICEKINESKRSGEFVECNVTTAAPYATEGNTPTDPYLSSSGNRCKQLLVENFSYVVPGYSGKRKNFTN